MEVIIIGDLIDLIYVVPDIINLFLSGFVFMTLFGWLNNKSFDISILSIWSLIISYVIKAFYATIHVFILNSLDFDEYQKVLIYLVTAIILAFISTKLISTKCLKKLLYNTNNKSVNEDIFDDIIDYQKPTMMQIYLKDSDFYYIGKFAFREEKGLDSWLVLVDYCSVKRNTNKAIYVPSADNINSTVAINLSNIESIQLVYEDDSEVWKIFSGKDSGSE